jgi:hypothetical protein
MTLNTRRYFGVVLVWLTLADRPPLVTLDGLFVGIAGLVGLLLLSMEKVE